MDEFDFDLEVSREKGAYLSLSLSSNSPNTNKDAPSLSQASSTRSKASSDLSSSIRSGGGKTKAARSKKKRLARIQEIEKSVRFSLSPSEQDRVLFVKQQKQFQPTSPASLLSNASSINGNGKRSNRFVCGSNKRHATLPHPAVRWSVDSHQSSLSSTSYSQQPDEVLVKGAGVNVLAVQDAGSYRMLLDECLYLCSTILTHKNPTTELWELANILSHKKHRSILFSSEETALQSILQVLARVSASSLKSSEDDNDVQSVDTQEAWDETQGSSQGGSSLAVLSASSSSASPTKTRAEKIKRFPNRSWPQSAYPALAAILHFLSWDCTLSVQHTASKTATAAQTMRWTLLKSNDALRGIAILLLRRDNANVVDEVPEGAADRIASAELEDAASWSTASSLQSAPAAVVTDPTLAGRQKRKRKRLDQPLKSMVEEDAAANSDQLSFSDESLKSPRARRLQHPNNHNKKKEALSPTSTLSLASKIFAKLMVSNQCSTCPTEDPTILALEALNRIIQGKDGEEPSCLDQEEEVTQHEHEELANDKDDNQEIKTGKIEASNPLIVTNTLLNKSGALPIIATAMSETLDELCRQSDPLCQNCLVHKASAIASLIDGSCLLSDDNREQLCANGKLMTSLLRVIHHQTAALELVMICMRTMTSLTHENDLAGQQLQAMYAFDDEIERVGTEILLHLLHTMVLTYEQEHDKEGDLGKQSFDVIVFCLNTLTNVVETAHIQTTLSTYFVPVQRGDRKAVVDEPDDEEEESFLRWLARWVVDQTSTFREIVLHQSFGKKQLWHIRKECYGKRIADGELRQESEEHLVIAGNGFILLACIMIKSEASIRQSILLQMPGGYTLIENTLRSFCNFYYYTVGDLSVAVVAPVKKLLEDLATLRTPTSDAIALTERL